jgi:hypothetical protein
MNRGLFTALAMTLPAASLAATQATGFAASYAFTLSSLTGRIASGWLELSYDPQAQEIYTVSGGMVRVFNRVGLEIYAFGQNEALGGIEGVAVLDDGDLVVLGDTAKGWVLSRCDSRGEFLGRIVPASRPAGFRPDAMVHANGLIYLASRQAMRVLVIEPSGAVVASHDLAERIGLDEEKRNETGLSGFNVDQHGNILFTIASLFKAYVVPPVGEVRSFGRPGGAPGRFNIANGIAADERGNIFVADSLKGAVIAFDKDFNFLGEFRATGSLSRGLRQPKSIVAGDGRVAVAQSTGGVVVYLVVAPSSGPGERVSLKQ